MDDTVDIRSLADIANLSFKVKETALAIHFHGKGGTIREMVDEGVDLAEINGICKNSFHSNHSQTEKSIFSLLAGLAEKRHKICKFSFFSFSHLKADSSKPMLICLYLIG